MKMLPLLGALLIGGLALAQHDNRIRGRIRQNPKAYELVVDMPLRSGSSLPACSGDTHCVALCKVSSTPDWQCYSNDGGVMSGMTQGNNSTYIDSFAHTADGGWFRALNYVDDTVSAAAIPRIDNAAIRAVFGGPHTIALAGYSGTVVNSNGGWWAMITDGTNFMQIRNGGSQFEFVETGLAVDATSGTCKDGWCVVGLRRSGATLTGRTMGVNGAGTGGDTVAAITGSNAFYMGGGTGGCCTPSGAMGGPLAWVAIYDESKSDAWFVQTEKNWYGAPALQSGGNGTAGTAPASLIGRDDLAWAGGGVPLFRSGAYITDPSLGVHSQLGFTNVWAADPLAAATWTDVGTPTVTTNASAGPFFRWKNTNECDLIVDDDGAAFEGKRSLASLASLGVGTATWANASCYLKAGTSGTTTTKARLRFTTDGTLDAGNTSCDFTTLSSTTQRAQCWAWIDNATSIKADVLVGNATSDTGSITACQCQLTASQYPESPTVDNTTKGSNWPELDGGAVPFGLTKGKLEAVFQVPTTSSDTAPYYLTRAVGGYVFDAYNAGASHTVLLSVSAFDTLDGGTRGEPGIQALMYGASASFENRFDIIPVPFDAGTFYVWSYEWHTEYGTLPDAGLGVGCRGLSRIDRCADPATCHASSIIAMNDGGRDVRFPLLTFGQNSGALGTCPLRTDIIDIGTRTAGSSPTSMWVNGLRIYR